MTKRKDSYDGSEMFDIFDKSADTVDTKEIREAVGSLNKRLAFEDEDRYGEFAETGIGQRNPGSSSPEDPRGSLKKPISKYWTKVPSSDEEKAIYYGVHIHTQDNPLGLHSHMIGGTLSGGHTHAPGNIYGEHYHGDKLINGKLIDGRHIHKLGENKPSGDHEHDPSNFG